MIDLPGQERKFHTPGILLIILGFSGLFWMVLSWNYSGKFWHEWYPLLVNTKDCSVELEEFLMDITGGGLVSESNSIVRYNGYSGQNEISVEDLRSGKRFYPADPRLDPYMKGSIAYFNQGIYRIFYLPRIYSPLRYFWVFSGNEILEMADWKLPDAEIPYTEIALFISLLVLLSWRSLRFSLAGGSFLLLGIHCILDAQKGILLILGITALFVRLILTGYGRDWRVWIFTLLSPALGLYWKLIDLPAAVFLLPVSAVAAGACLLIPERPAAPGKRGHDHRLFEPVPLIFRQDRDTVSPKVRVEIRPVMLGAAFLALLLGIFNFPGVRILPADLPAAENSGGAWTAGRINPDGIRSPLPDTGDFLRHRAYQEGFMYGAGYELPLLGGGVDLEDYGVDDGRVTGNSRRVLGFTESWFDRTLSEMSESGPSRLLRSETAPPVVRPQSSIDYGIPLHMLLAFAANIVIYVLIHMSGLDPARTRAVRIYGKSFFVLRRKQQAA